MATDSLAIASSTTDCKKGHRRLEHMCEKGMQIMVVSGKLQELKMVDLEFCKDCIYAKQIKVNFKKTCSFPKL